MIEQRGCELVYLPAYSPDYNPIEEAFAKIKNLLRKVAARTKEALVEAIGVALSTISAQGARDFSSMLDTVVQLTYCETCCKVLLAFCLLTLRDRLGAQPQRDVRRLHRLLYHSHQIVA